MRIAVVADIHGNVRALRAVMDDLREVAPDRVINLGDCVSGPLEAAETADLLISLAWTTVRGNHDRQLLDRPAEQMGRSDQAAFAELKSHHKGWLSSLEESVEFEGLLFCHGTPDSDHVYLCETVEPDGRVRLASRGEINRRLAGVQVPIVLCGHSHMVRCVGLDHDRLVVNPGSVGLPYETRPGAYWAILGPHIEHRRSDYDIDGMIDRARTLGFPNLDELVRGSLVDPIGPDAASEYFEQMTRGT